MKKANIGINAVLNVIKSSLSVIFPLITYPYALRVLGAANIGKVSYGQSIISYFGLIAMLGISSYGTREGAKRKKNPSELEQFVREVFTINVFSTIVAYALLILCLLFADKLSDYRTLLLLQSLSIVFTTFGVDWINAVYEDYLFITVRSIASHVICMILLFVFVRQPEDYFVYAFLSITGNLITCVSNWLYCRRYVKVRLTLRPNLSRHLKPLLILFANAIAISVYVNVDVTMLGMIKGDRDVGLYTVAVKVYSIIKTMLAAIYAVSVPRLASYIGEGRTENYKNLYSEMWRHIALILIPAGIGLICISDDVMLFMGGSEYLEAAPALQILSIALVFAIFGGLVTMCLNVPRGKEKINLTATIISAAMNVGLNFIFIPWLSYIGAAITTAISELCVLAYCLMKEKNLLDYLDWMQVKKSLVHAVTGSAIFMAAAYGIRSFLEPGMLRLTVVICACVIVYFSVMLWFKEEPIINMIRKFKYFLMRLKNKRA